MESKEIEWAVGITAVPERLGTLLPRTVASLEKGGFQWDIIFVDGHVNLPEWLNPDRVVERPKKIGGFGNFVLSAWELLLRYPKADRYAIFQDDMVCVRNMRQYLEQHDLGKHEYWNLYTFPHNVRPSNGWHRSDQMGKGAVGLVFSNRSFRTMLASEHIANRPRGRKNDDRSIDGAVVSAIRKANGVELVHTPSLLQHTGEESAIGNGKQAIADTFPGEDFDAMELMKSHKKRKRRDPKTYRIGLVGYNCASGLGMLNYQTATYAEIDLWLVKPHGHLPTKELHPDVDSIICKRGDQKKIADFLDKIDVVLFFEVPYFPELVTMAKQREKRVVCVPMIEWLPENVHKAWTKYVDLFVCPTEQCYNLLKDTAPCKYFPWPVDTGRFQFRKRPRCEEFLFINGLGGWQGRKGFDVVKEAKKLWPEMPLIVRSQVSVNIDARVINHAGKTELENDLYDLGDVLIAPHTVDGIGLEITEAMASGMPVITPNAPPWNEIPAIRRLTYELKYKKVGRTMPWCLCNPISLVEACKEIYKTDISEASQKAYEWARAEQWKDRASAFNELVRTGYNPDPIMVKIN
jgi:glycosyltransferase involved in cell wall biosynthesis